MRLRPFLPHDHIEDVDDEKIDTIAFLTLWTTKHYSTKVCLKLKNHRRLKTHQQLTQTVVMVDTEHVIIYYEQERVYEVPPTLNHQAPHRGLFTVGRSNTHPESENQP